MVVALSKILSRECNVFFPRGRMTDPKSNSSGAFTSLEVITISWTAE